MDAAEWERRLLAEIERLKGQHAAIERDWQRTPKILVLALAAIPVGFIWGLMWAVVVFLSVVALVGTTAYLLVVRRHEYESELADARRDLEKIRAQRRGRPTEGRTA
jgi:fatty acid desaturase